MEHSDGRHWELPGTDVLVEAPGAMLDPDARTVEVQTRSGRLVSVLSTMDVLLDRLDEFQATGSVFVGQQALALVRHVDESHGELELRAAGRRLSVVLERMSRLADEIHADRRAAPESDEFHEIARLSLEAEYDPRQR